MKELWDEDYIKPNNPEHSVYREEAQKRRLLVRMQNVSLGVPYVFSIDRFEEEIAPGVLAVRYRLRYWPEAYKDTKALLKE